MFHQSQPFVLIALIMFRAPPRLYLKQTSSAPVPTKGRRVHLEDEVVKLEDWIHVPQYRALCRVL
jgi:hypothetical protein